MKINLEKLEIAKARACMSTNDIIKAGIPKGTYNRITTTKSAKAVTIGKIARILNVDVTELSEYLIGAKEVSSLLGISESASYKIIKECNQELHEKGFITIRGKAPRVYLMERVGIKEVNA